mgnify:FL=1|nr:hypothetical protein [uncultured Sellimonas sp.]
MNHPQMKNLDPIKLELIKTAYEKTRGKSGKSLAPVMMSLIAYAGQNNIRFSSDEINLILDILKEGKTEDEKKQIDQMAAFIRATINKKRS